MKISVNQWQQSIQSEKESKKMDEESSFMDFHGTMMQMLSILSTSFQEKEMDEGEALLQRNRSMQNFTRLQEESMPLRSSIDLKGFHLDSLDLKTNQDILLQLRELLTSQDKEIPLDKMTEEGIQRIMELINSKESSVINEFSQKIDAHSLDKIFIELGKIQESIKERVRPSRALETRDEPQWTKQNLESTSRTEKKENGIQEKNAFLEKMEETIEVQEGSYSRIWKKIFLTRNLPLHNIEKEMQLDTIKEADAKESFIENEGIPSQQTDNQELGFLHQGLPFSKGLENMQRAPQQVEIQNMQDVANQMIEKMKVLREGDQSSLQVQLKPEELGEISVQLKMKDGKMVGEIFVENLSTKGAIEGQLENLRQRLSDQNISLNELNIHLQQEYQGEGQQRRQSFSHQKNPFPKKFIEEVSQEEEENKSQRYFQISSQKSYYTRGVKNSLNLLV